MAKNQEKPNVAESLIWRLEYAAKQGQDEVRLLLLPTEVEYLRQEHVKCTPAGGSYYLVAWHDIFENLVMSAMKELLATHKPKTWPKNWPWKQQKRYLNNLKQ